MVSDLCILQSLTNPNNAPCVSYVTCHHHPSMNNRTNINNHGHHHYNQSHVSPAAAPVMASSISSSLQQQSTEYKRTMDDTIKLALRCAISQYLRAPAALGKMTLTTVTQISISTPLVCAAQLDS
jgi:hypothetical protein